MSPRIAVAVLIKDGRVLLARRHPARAAYPDCWSLIGGHVEPGEEPEAAVVRECEEEIGVTITHAGPLDWPWPRPELKMHAYLVRRWLGEPENRAPQEHTELAWWTADEVASLRMAHHEHTPHLVALLEADLRAQAEAKSRDHSLEHRLHPRNRWITHTSRVGAAVRTQCPGVTVSGPSFSVGRSKWS